MTTDKDPNRKAFEVWLNNPHYGYTDSNKAMMFDAWKASRKQALTEAATPAPLLEACLDLATHVEGRLPIAGWLRDADKSRKALDKVLIEVFMEMRKHTDIQGEAG